jgi:hypothetical protein
MKAQARLYSHTGLLQPQISYGGDCAIMRSSNGYLVCSKCLVRGSSSCERLSNKKTCSKEHRYKDTEFR